MLNTEFSRCSTGSENRNKLWPSFEQIQHFTEPEKYPNVITPSDSWTATLERLRKKCATLNHEKLEYCARLRTEIERSRDLEKMLHANVVEHKKVVAALTALIELQKTSKRADVKPNVKPNEWERRIEVLEANLAGLRGSNPQAQLQSEQQQPQIQVPAQPVTQVSTQEQPSLNSGIERILESIDSRLAQLQPTHVQPVPETVVERAPEPVVLPETPLPEPGESVLSKIYTSLQELNERTARLQAQQIDMSEKMKQQTDDALKQGTRSDVRFLNLERIISERLDHSRPATPQVPSLQKAANIATPPVSANSNGYANTKYNQSESPRPLHQSSINGDENYSTSLGSASTSSVITPFVEQHTGAQIPISGKPLDTNAMRIQVLHDRLTNGEIDDGELDRYENIYGNAGQVLSERPQLAQNARQLVDSLRNQLPRKHSPWLATVREDLS